MNPRYFYKILILIGLLLPANLKAGVEPEIVSFMDGTSFIPSNNAILYNIIPGFIPGNNNWDANFKIKSLKNSVSLNIKPNHPRAINFPFNLSVKVKITYNVNQNPNPVQETVTLNVNYNPQVRSQYKQIDLFPFEGGCLVVVEVLSVTLPGLTNAQKNIVAEVVEMRSGILLERYYDFDENVVLRNNQVNHQYDATTDELKICWNEIQGAEDYDLEFKFIETYGGLPGRAFTFEENSTRINVTSNCYLLPVVYEEGYLVFRVRGNGRNPNDLTKRVVGRWSTGRPTLIGNPGKIFLVGWQHKYQVQPHESDDKNWQIVTTYAEEGKRKDVISYFDGTMRNRQTVTGLSTERMALVGETIYDHQGRPGVQVLPAPVNQPNIQFYNNFNRNSSNKPYNRKNFDLTTTGTCNVAAEGMEASSGAAYYYSPNWLSEPNQQDFVDYIPNSFGRPFTQVEYTPDNTGRIIRQGGVGDEHKLNSGHETKFFYGVPAQEELDAWFGNNVGFANNYKKNMTIDPNGQISLTYLDPKGNTIATSLAGNPPPNLDPIPSYANANQQIEIDLMEFNDTHSSDYSLTSNYTHLVSTAGNHDLRYTLTAESYTNALCMGAGVCYDCIYDLEIIILDNYNCQDTLFRYVETIGNLGSYDVDGNFVVDTNCDNFGFDSDTLSSGSISVYLPVGSYTILKKLTVNEAAADTYVEHFLTDPSNNCSQIWEDILDEEYTNMDTLGCNIDCNQIQLDATTLGPFDPNDPEDVALEKELADAEKDVCDTLPDTPCEIARIAMLNDMSPGGQYAKFEIDPANPGTLLPSDILSIFDPGNPFTSFNTSGSGYYGNPNIIYYDDDGTTQSTVINSSGSSVTPNNLTIAEFINNWQDSWAEALLEFHPEHCYLHHCLDKLQPGYEHNSKLLSVNTLSEANAAMFFDMATPQSLYEEDPFFDIGPGDKVVMGLAFDQFFFDNGVWYSMSDMAVASANCHQNLSCLVQGAVMGQDPTTADDEWAVLRAFYLSQKEKYIHQLTVTHAIGNYCYNGCIGADPFNSLENHFRHATGTGQFYEPQQVCNSNQYQWYKHKRKRFPNINDALKDLSDDYYSMDPKDIIDEMRDKAKDESDRLCKKCPVFSDLEIFIQEITIISELMNPLAPWHTVVTDLYSWNFELSQQLGWPDPRLINISRTTGPGGKIIISYPGSSCRIVIDNSYKDDISSLCCLTENNAPVVFSPVTTGMNFNMIATFADGNIQSVEGYMTCEIECPEESDPDCYLFPEATDLLDFYNYLLNIQQSSPGPITNLEINSVVIGKDLLKAIGASNQNFVKITEKENSDGRVLTILNDRGCNIVLDYPASGLDLSDVIAFQDIRMDKTRLDVNNNTGYFFIDVVLEGPGGTFITKTLSGYGDCLNIGYCCDDVEDGVPACIPTTYVDDVEWWFNLINNNGWVGQATVPMGPGSPIKPGFLGLDYSVDCVNLIWDAFITPDQKYIVHHFSCEHILGPVNVVCEIHISIDHPLIRDVDNFVNIVIVPDFSKANPNGETFHFIFKATANMLDGSTNPIELEGFTTCQPMGECPDQGVPQNCNPSAPLSDYTNWLNTLNGDWLGSKHYDLTDPNDATLLAFVDNIPQPCLPPFRYISDYSYGRITHTFYCENIPVCEFQLYPDQPFTNVNRVSTFQIIPDYSRADANGDTYHFTIFAQVIFNDGTSRVINFSGYSPCMLAGQCQVNNITRGPPTTKFSFLSQKKVDRLVKKQVRKINRLNSGQRSGSKNKRYPVPGNLNNQNLSLGTLDFIGFGELELIGPPPHLNCPECPVIQFRDGLLDPTANPDLELDLCLDPLCNPVQDTTISIPNNCVDHQINIAINNAKRRYKDSLQVLRKQIKAAYMDKCLTAAETFTARYYDARHHTTLYFYDQANNLVQTVPPKGVDKLNTAQITQAKNYRKGLSSTPQYPNHSMMSVYTFNSLNQLTRQKIPDHDGASLFFYDKFGRIILSQNAEQYPNDRWSFTFYDALNRIVETGEVESPNPPTTNDLNDQSLFENWVNTGLKTQITRTKYDVPTLVVANQYFNNNTDNYRGRIATVSYHEQNTSTYVHATHYHYDILGNVDTLVQDHPALGAKKMHYEYDLVSGNVNALYYQKGEVDQFIHKYHYDADNRITRVMTSPDGWIWDKEAVYHYYPHGPLARVELGDEEVQGMDYAYTLHGWLKGMNSGAGGADQDMGRDAKTGASNTVFAGDAAGFILDYYQNDYNPIATINSSEYFIPQDVGSDFRNMQQELFNGNISRMTTSIFHFDDGLPQGYTYTYDQLNRLKRLDAHKGMQAGQNQWLAGSNIPDYRSEFTYDANGNIMTLFRRGTTANNNPLEMDQMAYNYYSGNNRLEYVEDPVSSSNYDNDIDDQSPGNYRYDKIGNLTRDNAEGLTISWNVAGKVKRIDKSNGDQLLFVYDALGNRVSKQVNRVTTYYVRDASGNVLTTYRKKSGQGPGGFQVLADWYWESVYLYGSQRLGEFKVDKCIGGGCNVQAVSPNIGLPGNIGQTSAQNVLKYHRNRGQRRYELSNHLGNLLTVISDRKTPLDSDNDGFWESFEAEVYSAQDYYAFGMGMENLNYSFEFYSFGFNGYELNNDVKGKGNHYLFGGYGLDPRLGRRWNIDPKYNKYPYLSPYNFAGNSSLQITDPDGLELVKVHLPKSEYVKGLTVLVVDKEIASKVLELAEYAVTNKITVHYNSAFRSSEQQESIQTTGTTPASVGTSRHEAGFAIDFNLYDENGKIIKGNTSVTSNNKFIKKAKEIGFRWGGEFSSPDRIHIDAWNPLEKSKYGYENWKEAYLENQGQIEINDYSADKGAEARKKIENFSEKVDNINTKLEKFNQKLRKRIERQKAKEKLREERKSK